MDEYNRPTGEPVGQAAQETGEKSPWIAILDILWGKRFQLMRVGFWALVVSTVVAFVIPKQYESTVRIMPPDNQSGSAAMMAALAGRGVPSGLGLLAGNMMGLKNTGALFVDLLGSRTIQDDIVDRYDLQNVYWARYKQDARKKLAKRTAISEDRKSGVITIVVTDTDRKRAQDMATAYVQELDKLVSRVSTSSARRQRMFIEQRLATVQQSLQTAEQELSEFSSKNMTLDVKEQTKAMVEAGASLQAQLIAAQAELRGLQQAYGDENVRVRGVRAKISELQYQLGKFSGTGKASAESNAVELYPPLKKLPSLGTRWADLYRTAKVQEAVFELLTQQYELAKMEEAKEIPTVQVVDSASYPEKKSWPPRALVILASVLTALCAATLWILAHERWGALAADDPRKVGVERAMQFSREVRLRNLLPANWRGRVDQVG